MTPFKTCPWIHHGQDRFAGRERELAEVLEALIAASQAGDDTDGSRLVTLTGEAAAGKTALAAAAAEQAHQRQLFPGGIFEISCELIREPELLLDRVLETFDATPEERRGDLRRNLCVVLDRQPGPRLLVLDHLDPLVSHEESVDLFESLSRSPDVTILATCRQELDVLDSERAIEVGPLSLEESLDVFLSYLDAPDQSELLRRSFADADDPLRWTMRSLYRLPLSVRRPLISRAPRALAARRNRT